MTISTYHAGTGARLRRSEPVSTETSSPIKTPPLPSRAKRPIPKASKGHFVGELVFNRGPRQQRLGFASLNEHNVALCLLYRADCHDLEEQLAGLPFTLPNGRSSRHHFDFRFTRSGGFRICISVKPERVAKTYEYQAKFAEIKKAAIGNICDAVATITERNIDPVLLHNAKLFHAARDPEPEIDHRISDGLADLDGHTSISDFLSEIDLGGAGFFGLARALRFERARLFAPGRITGSSLIARGEGI
ncbi:hypothetical protein [Palleronia abyssalis]|uniref:TnsA endonuclease N-terminal domain-containing protein n=1 Tax=Palleronia abyssalis TaxID=1501240 RepID=A0A2R8BWP4_9RHOB|nr:hypothetical protein [Palleronia abyssalis]SPJ24587.1 hypothetical protein PAA8504_02421 [Palleronia abyssalis]